MSNLLGMELVLSILQVGFVAMLVALQVVFAVAVVLLSPVAAYYARRFLEFVRQFIILSRLPYRRDEPFFLGSALELLKPKRMHLALREWSEQLGGIYTFRVVCFHVRRCTSYEQLYF